MIVTNIEQQKRRHGRVNVYVDGSFAFGLEKDTLIRFGIRKGGELTAATLRQIQSAEEISLAKRKALHYLSYRMRTEQEVRTKLLEQEFSPAVINAVIEEFKSLRFINDEEFARAFIRTTQLRKPSGTRLLDHKLRLKGVPREIAARIIAEETGSGDQRESAAKAASKYVTSHGKSWSRLEGEKQKRRIAQFLSRRGFDWGTISTVLKKLFQSVDPSPEDTV